MTARMAVVAVAVVALAGCGPADDGLPGAGAADADPARSSGTAVTGQESGAQDATDQGRPTAAAPSPPSRPTAAATTPAASGGTPATTPPLDPAARSDDALRAFVEDLRRVDLPDRAGQVERVDDEAFFADLPDVIPFVPERDWKTLRVLGLTEPGATWRSDMQARRDRIRGLCCPSLLREGTDGLEAAMVKVHELGHQADDLAVPDSPYPASPELTPVAAGIVEGSAQRTALAWLDTLPPVDRAAVAVDVPIFRPQDLDAVSDVVARLLSFGYAEGRVFAEALAEQGGEDAVDAALADPPTTSEQVLFPAAYLADEGAAPVPRPPIPPNVERVADQRLGAFVVQLLAEPTLGVLAARELAGRWDGDALAGWSADGEDCVALDLRMDDAEAAATVADLLGEDTTVDGRQVRLDRCVEALPAAGR